MGKMVNKQKMNSEEALEFGIGNADSSDLGLGISDWGLFNKNA